MRSDHLVPSDPPLSALGHEQARACAARLVAREKISAILCSPYLRALQTAQPLAQATGLPLLVDFAAAEAHQRPASLPPIDARLPYFPEVEESYTPMMHSVVVDTAPGGKESGVEPRLEHLRRMLYLAQCLPRHPQFAGKTVAIFTHAASIALVAAFTGASTLEAAGRFAPCGVCKLVVSPVDGPVPSRVSATLVERGADSSAYAPQSEATKPWGFADSSEALDVIERLWVEAQARGPTDVSSLVDPPAGAQQAVAGGGRVKEEYAPESLA